MDKDLKESIKKVAQAERLADEEKMSARNISGIIEVNEDIEDNNELILKLRRKLKNWKISFWTGFLVLIVILLYMIYSELVISAMHGLPTEVNDLPVQNNQIVEEYSVFYKLECPQLDKSDIESSTIQTVAKQRDDWAVCIYPNYNLEYDLSGGFYHVEPNQPPVLAPDDTVYFYDSLIEVFNNQSKKYSVSDEDFDIPDYREYNESPTKGLENTYIGSFDTIDGYDYIEFYNEEIARDSSDVPEDRIADIIDPLKFEIVFYNDVDVEGIKSVIKDALAEGTYQDTNYNIMEEEYTYTNIGVDIIEAIKTVTPEFEITIKSSLYEDVDETLYSYYDSVETEDDKIVCVKDGNREIPEKVVKLNITDYEILYDELLCAYHFGWY